MAPRRVYRTLAILQPCLLLCLLALSGCGKAELSEVPAELLGIWHTDTPGYERSFLEIERREFVIGMGRFALYEYAIDRIEAGTDRAGNDIIELHYMAEEGYPDKLVLVLDRSAPNTFKLRSRSQAWVRDS